MFSHASNVLPEIVCSHTWLVEGIHIVSEGA